MIVDSDTSPLNYLVLVNAIDVLPKLFGEIHVPPQVLNELQLSRAPEIVKEWAQSPLPWLRVSTPATNVTTSVRLHSGEAQAIALANELGADAVLIDERKGRRVAEEHGLHAVGTIGVLEFAAERAMLDLRTTLEALRATTFYISDAYIEAALERDANRRRPEHDQPDPGVAPAG